MHLYESRTCRARFPADRRMLIRSALVRFQSSRLWLSFAALARLGVTPRFARTAAFGGCRASRGSSLRSDWLNSARCSTRGEHIRGEVYPWCGNQEGDAPRGSKKLREAPRGSERLREAPRGSERLREAQRGSESFEKLREAPRGSEMLPEAELCAQNTIFVVPEKTWRSNYYIRSACERLAPEVLYL